MNTWLTTTRSAIIKGWVHRRQLIVIEYLQAQNRLLRGRLSGKPIRFADAERALLTTKAKTVGRQALLALDAVFLRIL